MLAIATDHVASGEDLYEDFVRRSNCWAKVVRVALTTEQVEEHGLPILPGNGQDSRAAKFRARFGRLIQVELDALPPEVLRGLYADAIAEFWDDDAYRAVLAIEEEHRTTLRRLRRGGDE